MVLIDVVTVWHNRRNHAQHEALGAAIALHDPGRARLIAVDNQADNRGFARACNLGAKEGDAPVLGFINPDAEVHGPFAETVAQVFAQEPGTVITGCRFGKAARELHAWGCHDWVCGAAMFVRRPWFEEVGGFDEGYHWGWEDTALCRTAQAQRRRVHSVQLPITHQSPHVDTPADVRFKQHWFQQGAERFYRSWGRR